jgi:hypothetical protein
MEKPFTPRFCPWVRKDPEPEAGMEAERELLPVSEARAST